MGYRQLAIAMLSLAHRSSSFVPRALTTGSSRGRARSQVNVLYLMLCCVFLSKPTARFQRANTDDTDDDVSRRRCFPWPTRAPLFLLLLVVFLCRGGVLNCYGFSRQKSTVGCVLIFEITSLLPSTGC